MNSIKKMHKFLCAKQAWYRKWHECRYCPSVHVAILAIFVAFMSVSSWLPHRFTWADANAVVIASAANNQQNQKIVSDGADGAIVVWRDDRDGAASFDAYAQRLNSSNVAAWTANGVRLNSDARFQSVEYVQMAAVSGGGAVVIWSEGSDGIYGQHLNNDGTSNWTAGGIAIANQGVGAKTDPQIVADGSGNFIISWDDGRADAPGIYVQKIDLAGAIQWGADGVRISDQGGSSQSESNVYSAKLTADGSAGAIVTWVRNGDPEGAGHSDLFAQRVNSSGTPQWTSGGVTVTSADLPQNLPIIAGNGSGGSYIIWNDYRNYPLFDDADLYGQYLNSSGTPQWIADGILLASGGTGSYDLVADAGNMYVAWSGGGAYLKRIDINGAAVWGSAITLNAGGSDVDLIFDSASGDLVTAYTVSNVVNLKRFSIGGAETFWMGSFAPNPTGSDQLDPVIAPDGDNGIIAVWNEGAWGSYNIYGDTVEVYPAGSNRTLYVDANSGVNKASCGLASGASACESIQYAVNLSSSGDTISVASGTYDEALSFGSKNLTLNGNNVATLTDTSRPGDNNASIVEVDGGQNSFVIKNFTITVNNNTPNAGISFSNASGTIENNVIQNSSSNVLAHYAIQLGAQAPGAGTIIRDNTITVSSGAGGMYLNQTSAVVDGNTIDGGGIETWGGTDMTMVNNVVYGVSEYGFKIQAQGGNTTAVVANNTIYGKTTGIIFMDQQVGGGAITAYVKNNLISGNTTGTSMLLNQSSGDPITLTSDYNLFNIQTNYTIVSSNNTTYNTLAEWTTATGNDSHSQNTNPLLTSPGTADFTLQNTSPAIGAGTDDLVGVNDLATYSANADKTGAVRPATDTAVDLGAYESDVADLVSVTISAGTTTLNTGTPFTQMTATGNYSDASTQNLTSSVSWASSDTDKVTIGASGLARGMGTGSANITATFGELTSNSVTINTSGLPDYLSLYFDAASGDDDTGDGTMNSPYQTLTKLATELSPRMRAYLKGTFTGSLSITSGLSGNSTNNTWITNWPSETATINAGGVEAEYAIQINGADYITIQGLTLTNAAKVDNGSGGGIRLIGAPDYITINGNVIHGNTIGIYNNTEGAGGTNHTYSNNRIYNNPIGGLLLANNSDVAAHNNVIYENRGNMVQAGIALLGTIDGVSLWNNTIVNHPGGNIGMYDFGVGLGEPSVTNLTVKNNLLVQTTLNYVANISMISAINANVTNAIDYNLYYTTNSVPFVSVDDTNYNSLSVWQAVSTHDDNSVSGDPAFTSLPGDDYTLENSSAAINVGTASTTPGLPAGIATDIVSFARNSRYDMGAYESDVAIASGGSSFQIQDAYLESSESISRELILATAKVKVNFGDYRDEALIKMINALMRGELNVEHKEEIQVGLKKLFNNKPVIGLSQITSSDAVKAELLRIDSIGRFLVGQRSENLILEIWEAGSYTNLLASVNVRTDLWGEANVVLPLLPEGVYDFTIRKRFSVAPALYNQTLARGMMLDFSGNKLRVGDLNNDSRVDARDFAILIQKSKTGDVNWQDYDFDESGALDIYDFSDLMKNIKE